VQSKCHAEVLRILPPTVFWPRPKVHSAIIQIVPQPHLRDRIPDLPFFHTFVRSMFFHRRKFLRSVVLSAFKKELTKPQVDAVLTELNLGPDARAEQLDVEQMLELCEHFRAVVSHAS
jgi:16S rRNA (adenine1518-N6/adenine1519-N6)-dimethyltransferase